MTKVWTAETFSGLYKPASNSPVTPRRSPVACMSRRTSSLEITCDNAVLTATRGSYLGCCSVHVAILVSAPLAHTGRGTPFVRHRSPVRRAESLWRTRERSALALAPACAQEHCGASTSGPGRTTSSCRRSETIAGNRDLDLDISNGYPLLFNRSTLENTHFRPRRWPWRAATRIQPLRRWVGDHRSATCIVNSTRCWLPATRWNTCCAPSWA
ncbi:MAG: hypothetical protein JWR11_4491 [Mycobacterium sp.]|nr:hypothetical protein [Mycobacterium sp.]MDT5070051.1 hypothetical protein [Mycobacterium sp.]MDT5179236.1 hypothetical protein [Mycobacterium sp.]